MDNYLFKYGSTVTSVDILQGVKRDIVSSVIAYCANLRCLHLCDDSMRCMDLRRLLVSHSNLTELHIEKVPVHEQNISPFEDVRLPELRVLSIRNFFAMGDRLVRVHKASNLLEWKLEINEDNSKLKNIIRMCPQLRALSTQDCAMDCNIFKAIVLNCRNIVHLDLEGTSIRDDYLSGAGSFLDHLQSLNIQRCEHLTSTSWLYTRQCWSHSLHTLYLTGELAYERDYRYRNTHATILFYMCTQLRTLSWKDSTLSYKFTPAIRNLTTLILDGTDALCNANLITVGKYCTKLKTLCIYSTSNTPDSVRYTDAGLHALVVGCPKLTHLILRTHWEGVVSPHIALSLRLWQLKISEDEESMLKLRYNVLDMPV